MVLNMEVVEHVDNVPLYMKSCADLVKPGGLMLTATLNRTLRARAFAIFAAERVLRWLPVGTHDWNKFLTPDEIKTLLTRNGLKVTGETGVVFHPLADEWRKSRDMAINYMVMAERPAARLGSGEIREPSMRLVLASIAAACLAFCRQPSLGPEARSLCRARDDLWHRAGRPVRRLFRGGEAGLSPSAIWNC